MQKLEHNCDKCEDFEHCIANGYSRQDFLKLPMEERRRILKRQVAELMDKQALEDKGMME